MSTPIVSVVVPSHNAGPLLRRAVRSVLEQTIGELEVLVIDDGSTDGSAQTMTQLDRRIRVIRLHGPSGSPAAPRNVGMAAARGTWTAFLDADDSWSPTKLEQQIEHMRASRRRASCTNAMAVNDREGSEHPYFQRMPSQLVMEEMIRRNWVITSSLMGDSRLLRSCGRFPGNGPSVYEDWAFWLRVATVGPLAVVAEPLVRYRNEPTKSYRSRFGSHGILTTATMKDFVRWCRANSVPLSRGQRSQVLLSVVQAFAHDLRVRATPPNGASTPAPYPRP